MWARSTGLEVFLRFLPTLLTGDFTVIHNPLYSHIKLTRLWLAHVPRTVHRLATPHLRMPLATWPSSSSYTALTASHLQQAVPATHNFPPPCCQPQRF